MQQPLRTVTAVLSSGGPFLISVEDAERIDAAFDHSGQGRFIWVIANPGTGDAVRIHLNVDQVVYIADK